MSKYTGQIQAELKNYSTLGAKAWGRNHPPEAATTLDTNETGLHARANQAALAEHALYKHAENDTAKQLSEMEHAFIGVESTCQTIFHDEDLSETASHQLAQERLALVKLKAEQLRREADLRAFRAMNNVSRQAHYPEDRWVHVALVAIFVLLETGLNAFFYENAQGLLGGAFIALGVSATNLGIAFMAGMAFRYKNLSAPGWRAFGWVCGLTFLVSVIYMNALFAAFRSEYQLVLDPSDLKQSGAAFTTALGAAGQIFLLHMPATDLQSFVLFFFGILCSAFAFYKGYTFDDKYPDHGKLDRLHRQADAQFEGACLIAKEKLRIEIDRRRDAVSNAKLQLSQATATLTQVRGRLSNAFNEMQTALARIQQDFKLVLETYRQMNTTVRSVPAPAYFAQVPDVVSNLAAEPSDSLAPRFASLQASVEDYRDRYMDPLTKKLQTLTNEGKDLLGNEFGAFLAGVERDAQTLIGKATMVMPHMASAA